MKIHLIDKELKFLPAENITISQKLYFIVKQYLVAIWPL